MQEAANEPKYITAVEALVFILGDEFELVPEQLSGTAAIERLADRLKSN